MLLTKLRNFKRNFSRGEVGDEFKLHLVNWFKICSLICSGGLGVKNLTQFNRALLGKWLCRYATEIKDLRRLVVETKYDSMKGGCCSGEVDGHLEVEVWKNFRRGFVFFFVRYEVGDRSKMRFWHDLWCMDHP